MADLHRDWPRAIDDVARRMTDGDAAVDVRARVLDRIADLPRAERGWSWSRSSVLRAGAVAAAILVALGIWPRTPPPVPTTSVGVTRAPGAVAPDPERTTPASGVSPTADASRRRVVRAVPVDRPGLPILAGPSPIAFEAIQPDALAIPPLEVTPIVSTPLRISGTER